MNRAARVIACALLLAPAGACAYEPGTFADLYLVPFAGLEIGNASSDGGFGFGARGRFAVTPDFFLQAEYQDNAYDRFEGGTGDPEASDLRLGGGFLTSGDARVYGLFEFVQIGLKIDGVADQEESGYGVHLGFRGEGDSHAYGQVGFLDVGDLGDGFEFLIGGVIAFGPVFGMFVDYRLSTLEEDLGAESRISDLRIGGRLSF
jgi:hypothetical protein